MCAMPLHRTKNKNDSKRYEHHSWFHWTCWSPDVWISKTNKNIAKSWQREYKQSKSELLNVQYTLDDEFCWILNSMNELLRRPNPVGLLQINKIVSYQVKPIKLFIFCSFRVLSRELMIAESRSQSKLIPSTGIERIRNAANWWRNGANQTIEENEWTK